jgi:hypothetical protein
MSKHAHNFCKECDMKRQVKPTWQWFPTVIGVVFGVIAVAGPAYGDTFRFKGIFADALFESIDETQCVFTSVSVFAVDAESKLIDPPGPPSAPLAPEAFLDISQFDSCASTQLADAFCAAPLADGELQVAGPDLASATLNTTLGCFDSVSGSPFDVSVDLRWVAVGDLNRDSFTFREPPFVLILAAHGTSRFAEASGRVSDGITDFTPELTENAFISTAKSVEVIH